MKTFPTLFLFLVFSVLSISTAISQVSVGNVLPGRIDYTSFELRQPEKIKISGQNGIYVDDYRIVVFYGWILNTETRKVVWHQIDRMSKMGNLDYGDYKVEDEVSLDKGRYELYFTGAFAPYHNNWDHGFFSNFFAEKERDDFSSRLPNSYFSRSRVKYRTSLNETLGLTLTSQNIVKTDIDQQFNSKISDAVVSITKPSHNANVKKGFSLSATTNLSVYAIGEGTKEESFDYAWIYDMDNYKRVWEMEYYNTDFAGGADKNLKASKNITLPAGNYVVSYVSDDSHGYNDWNSMPPDDPQFYGITVWASSEKDKKNVIPFKKSEEIKPVLEISMVRDHEFRSQGLKVKAPVELRLLCLGESSSDEMADGGWIINATTRNVVWDMNDAFLQHAGGAKKNKMFDGKIKLDKGDYIVYYATDDSHSYKDWNSGPPHEQDYWGITLWAAKNEDINKVELFNPDNFKSDKVIAEITQVRDNQYRSESFTLNKDTKLRIHAIGEGTSDLVDFGWIKNNDTGKIVWEMTYRTTDHAGGAQKNRRYNGVIILPKGSYKVYYQTDGSHSYRDWNSSPPREAEMYGITIQVEDN